MKCGSAIRRSVFYNSCPAVKLKPFAWYLDPTTVNGKRIGAVEDGFHL